MKNRLKKLLETNFKKVLKENEDKMKMYARYMGLYGPTKKSIEKNKDKILAKEDEKFYRNLLTKANNYEVWIGRISKELQNIKDLYYNNSDYSDVKELHKSYLNIMGSLGGYKTGADVSLSSVDNVARRISRFHLNSDDLQEKIEKDGSQWVVKSKSGETLGTHDTKEDAVEQLQAIEANK